jgi:hypothetical protein
VIGFVRTLGDVYPSGDCGTTAVCELCSVFMTPFASGGQTKVATITFIWLAFLALNVEFSFGLIGFSSFLVLAVMAGVFVFVGGLFVIRQYPGVSKWAAVVVAFNFSILFATLLVHAHQRQWSELEAHRIIDAVERYRTETGTMPESLGVLVPKFIPYIPRTWMGFSRQPFNYGRFFEKDGYRLGFPGGAGLSYRVYSFDQKCWFTNA